MGLEISTEKANYFLNELLNFAEKKFSVASISVVELYDGWVEHNYIT